MTTRFNIPLQPRGLLLFCWQKSKQKTMSAVSASLKIGDTSLKIRNLSPFHSAFGQTDFLRFVPPIFLTLTSQGGNQGIANAMDKKTKSVFERFRFLQCKHNSTQIFRSPICLLSSSMGYNKTNPNRGDRDLPFMKKIIILLSKRFFHGVLQRLQP